MKATIKLIIFSIFTITSIFQALYAVPEIGKNAPFFKVVDTNGKDQSLDEFNENIVVLEWTNHECPFVKKFYSSKHMQALQKQYTDKGVVWLSVMSSASGKEGHVSAQKANELTTSKGANPSAVLFDEVGDMGRAYDAKTTPHMYIIDKGKLAYMGGIDSIRSTNVTDINKATPYFANALDEVLAGNPVSKAITPPYGCSVKY